MKFSIFSEKNQQTDAQSQLFIFQKLTSELVFSYLDSSKKEHLKVLAQAALQDDKNNFYASITVIDDVLHNIAALHVDDEINRFTLSKECQQVTSWLKKLDQQQAIIDLSLLNTELAKVLIDVLSDNIATAFYTYSVLKQKVEPVQLKEIIFILPENDELQAIVYRANIRNQAMDFARDLGNAPANICTPEFLAQEAKNKAERAGAQVKIHDLKEIEAIGMNSFLSVAKGSEVPPYFIELSYQGASQDEAPIVLIGKGITFDSGGISLKPGEGMDEMKYDMLGASSVIATFCAAAELKLPLNLIALVPTCENMPSGRANKPGDIVKSLKGLSIEVLNTDAEGRLILCDALTYAERFKPKAVIDIATLTGACIIALGHVGSGIMGNDQALVDDLLDASVEVNDKAWQLPLWEEFNEQLKSNFADIANIGGRPAGTITAGIFLSRFTEDYTWAHIDVAGTAWRSGDNKGATGRPVPLLLKYLINQVEK